MDDKPAKAIVYGSGTARIAPLARGVGTVWDTYTWAPAWYRDASAEASRHDDHDARRREVVLAVAALESYLLEWVRDEVLKRDFRQVTRYFPPGSHPPIKERWKKVIQSLHSDGLIANTPSFSEPYWAEFATLLTFRDGLIHGRSSRPRSAGQRQDERPLPTKQDLDNMQPGWARDIVAHVIRKLHEAVRTPLPQWLSST